VLALVAGTYLLMKVAWGWFLPTAAPHIETDNQPLAAAALITENKMFGAVAGSGRQQANLPRVGEYQLTGTIASLGKAVGYAILKKDGEKKARVVATGEEISPGLKLVAVEKTTIRIAQDGVESLLRLPDNHRDRGLILESSSDQTQATE